MAEDKKNLVELFKSFSPGISMELDAKVNGTHLKGIYVYVGNHETGVKCIKAELIDNRIKYDDSCTIIESAEQVNSINKIPPLLEYFNLPIYGEKRKNI